MTDQEILSILLGDCESDGNISSDEEIHIAVHGASSAPDVPPIIPVEQDFNSEKEIEQLLKRRKLNIKWGSKKLLHNKFQFVEVNSGVMNNHFSNISLFLNYFLI